MHLSRCSYDDSLKNKVLQYFLSMNLITRSQHLFSLAVSFGKEMKNTERFEAHRLKVKLQNESNVHILKLCFFYYSHSHCKFKGSRHNLKSTYMSPRKSATTLKSC